MFKGMKIKDRPEFQSKAKTLSFRPDSFVGEAAKAMSAKNYGSVLVTDENEKLLGIVTERDLMRRVVAQEKDPATTTLKEIMTQDLKTAKPDDFIVDWLRQMSNERFRHLPVIDDTGHLISMMSQGDFVSYTWPELHLGRNYRAYYIISSVALYALIMAIAVRFFV